MRSPPEVDQWLKMPYFISKKSLQWMRQDCSQFLPGKRLATQAQLTGLDGAQDRVPGFQQVRPASVPGSGTWERRSGRHIRGCAG